MDDYTPATEEVRWGYADRNLPSRDEQGEAEFDRWLAEHDRVVAASAWDEGAKSASPDWYWHDDGKSENPYRITEED